MSFTTRGFDQNLTYFECSPKLSKIPNIFIHGVGLDNSMWIPQKKYFQKNEIIFYDLINHGKSKKGYKKLNFQDFTKQLNDLVKYLNIKKFNLIGFSIGAIIAQYFAVKYQSKINKLILIASIYNRTSEEITKVRNRYNIAYKGKNISDDSINRWFNKKYLEKNPKVYKYFNNILKKKKNSDFLPAYKAFVNAKNYKIDFSNFNIPTLIMTGENDIGSTSRMSKMLKKKIKNSKIYIIPKAKHMATFEKPRILLMMQIALNLFFKFYNSFLDHNS